jgi:iron complex outermembrane receptor protein
MRRARCTPAPLALAAALTLALAVAHAPRAHAQVAPAAEAFAIDIPAQPLGQALNELARQANLQMTFPATLVSGKTSAAVSGQLTARQALDRLLAGQGLVAAVEGSSVVVKQAPPAAAIPQHEATLPPIRVTAGIISPLKKNAEAGAFGNRSVLDTPFSMKVVESNEIVERGAKSIGQIFFNDASVYTPTPSAQTDWWGTQIRGLPVRNNYVDGIPMLLFWGGDFPTEVIDSVTALKGLTGFMYGFGEPGGALSYKLKRPKATNETTVNIGYRNPSLVSVHADVNYRLGDDTGIRTNLANEQGKAYNAAEIDRKMLSLAVDKRFNASFDWFTTLMYEKNRNTGEPFQFYFSRYDISGSGGVLPEASYRYDDFNVDNSFYETETVVASTGFHWKLNEQWGLKTQFGTSRKDHRSNKSFAYIRDRDGNYDAGMYNFAGRLETFFTQAMLQGTFNTGSLKHELVAGLGLQRSTDKYGNFNYFVEAFSGNLYETQSFVSTATPDMSLGPSSNDVRQRYAFVSDTLHFNEHWQAIAGLRYTDYEIRDGHYGARKASPTLALIYKPKADIRVYGSYVEGLEAGTVVPAGEAPPDDYKNAGTVLPATVSKQYELGVKHDSDSLDLSAALFRVDRVNQVDERRGADRYLTQDGLVVYQGMDLSGTYKATRALNLGASVVYLDATLKKMTAGQAALEGNAPAYASQWQGVVTAEYKLPSVPGLKLHGNVRYFGKSYTSDANTLLVPSYTLANAGVSYDFRVAGHDLSVFGNVYNLFNTKYWSGGGWSSGNIGEARNYSLTLSAQF